MRPRERPTAATSTNRGGRRYQAMPRRSGQSFFLPRWSFNVAIDRSPRPLRRAGTANSLSNSRPLAAYDEHCQRKSNRPRHDSRALLEWSHRFRHALPRINAEARLDGPVWPNRYRSGVTGSHFWVVRGSEQRTHNSLTMPRRHSDEPRRENCRRSSGGPRRFAVPAAAGRSRSHPRCTFEPRGPKTKLWLAPL